MISKVAVIDKTGRLDTARVTTEYLIEYLVSKEVAGTDILNFINRVKLGEAIDGATISKKLASVTFQPIVVDNRQ